MSKLIRVGGLLLLAVVAQPLQGSAQTVENDVEAAVRGLFDAMRTVDGAAAGALFHPEARLTSVAERDGGVSVSSSAAADFVRAVGTPRTQVWDERISNLRIEVDGALATAWMDYAFYLGDRFSHCGVNAIQLVRVNAAWRIVQITDTRRQTGCSGA